MIPDVIVVLDPAFGSRLELLTIAPIWIVATEANKAIYSPLWQSHKHTDHREKGAITAFEVTDSGERLKNFFYILPDVETHHGQAQGNYLLFPEGFVIQVIGVRLNEDVINGLQEYKFSSFVETPDGFNALK